MPLPARESPTSRALLRNDGQLPALLRPRLNGEPARYVIGISKVMTLYFGVLVSLVFARRRLMREIEKLLGPRRKGARSVSR